MSLIDIFKKKKDEGQQQPQAKKKAPQKKTRNEKEKTELEQKPAKATETVAALKHKNPSLTLGNLVPRVARNKNLRSVKNLVPRFARNKNEQISGEMAWVLQFPQISEKAGFLAESNQYIFRVSKRANKTEVKKAIEGTFGINVASVRIINVPEKERRVGGKIGFKKGYKKAIVKIKEGQKIEVLPR